MMWKQLFRNAPKDRGTAQIVDNTAVPDPFLGGHMAARTGRAEVATKPYTPTSAEALLSAARSVY
jgi:hypothetical protein